MEDAYAALGLDHGASSEEITAAYHRLVRRYPPELNPRRFARIRQAYEYLSSYERRMRQAAGDPEGAFDLLFPRVEAFLQEPPEPPEPLGPEDWAPVMSMLRERMIRTILHSGMPPPPEKS